MDETDEEVANILAHYVQINGVPQGANTRSKFGKLTVAFKQKYQLGYHEYKFSDGGSKDTPKPNMRYFF